MKHRRFRAPIVHRDSDQNVFRISLSVFNEDIEITVVIKYPSIEQFVFELFARAAAVRFYQVA